MIEKEVTTRFLNGIELFNHNKPQPLGRDNRIESLGWRHANKEALELELTLAGVVEAYCELNREGSDG
jgi:hypothetical protein